MQPGWIEETKIFIAEASDDSQTDETANGQGGFRTLAEPAGHRITSLPMGDLEKSCKWQNLCH